MGEKKSQRRPADRTSVAALEADVAFFDARLSLASKQPDTAYQQAQKKTYEILGSVMGNTLKKLRSKPKK